MNLDALAIFAILILAEIAALSLFGLAVGFYAALAGGLL